MSFEKGTEIFNARGTVRTVALDNREKSGILWGRGREKIGNQGWFEKDDAANADLWAFIQLNKESAEPLILERRAIERRIGRLREFAMLVAQAVATGRATQYALADCLKVGDSFRSDSIADLTDKMGTPLKNEHAYMGFDYYEATVSGLPYAPVVKVIGTNGQKMLFKGSTDFKGKAQGRTGDGRYCCNEPGHSCCGGHR